MPRFLFFRFGTAFKLGLLAVIPVILISCSAGVRPDVEESGTDLGVLRWSTKVQVTDKAKNQKQYMTVESIVEGVDKLRLEAQSSMGIQVASLIADSRSYSCMVYSRKTLYTSSAESASLKPLVKVDLHPLVLLRVLKGQTDLGAGWECGSQGETNSLNCTNKDGIVVTEVERTASSRKIRVESPKFELLWVITDPATPIKPNPLLFQLEKKDNYKLIRL